MITKCYQRFGRLSSSSSSSMEIDKSGKKIETESVTGVRRRKPWTSPISVLKSVGPKLVPFWQTVAIYFVLHLSDGSPTFLRCLAKCAPIFSLIVFVLLHGINLSKEYAFARAILLGLVFSAIGDAMLCYNYLTAGMIFFGLTQINYARAFGFRPLKLYVLAVLASLAVVYYWYIFPGLTYSLTGYVVVYISLINIMVWRALARVELVDELWTWTKLCSSAGAVSFMISDLMIGIHKFAHPIPYSDTLIMTTYYAAQLGIALSVVDSKKARKTD